jgi:diguanylate cyclase (GGDEF)-like protein
MINLTVEDIMTREIITIAPYESIKKASEVMEERSIGCLPVIENGKLVGIITSRDIRGTNPNRLVADAMTKTAITAHPGCSLWEAKEAMERNNIERLVVVEDNEVVGLVTKKLLYGELGKHTDLLTGFERAECLQHRAVEMLQEGKEIAVVFIDLDNFGAINKEFGHVKGDEVLKQAAHIFRGIIDDATDKIYRYGGDEFAVLSTKSVWEAKELANRMIAALSSWGWPVGLKVTASAGVAGGRRKVVRFNGNLNHMMADLINMASLASTKAKREKVPVVVAEHAIDVVPAAAESSKLGESESALTG